MFQTSNYSLSNLQSAVQYKIEDTVANETVVRAVRECLKIYAKYERRYNPERARRHSGVLSITSTGYDLGLVGLDALTAWVTSTAYAVGNIRKDSNVGYVCVEAHTSGAFATDLAAGKWEVYKPLLSDCEGFHVFLSDASGNFYETMDEYLPVSKGGSDVGRYIENNVLYIYPSLTTSINVVFRYFRAPVLPSANKIDMTQTLPIEFGAEEMFEEFVLARFFRRDGIQISSQDAEARFREQLADFFGNNTPKAVFL